MSAQRPLTIAERHDWFAVQAGWSRATRTWLYRQARLSRARTVLEVGCGSGVILRELTRLGPARVVGLDLDAALLFFARRTVPGATLLRGDGQALPFADGTFDIVLCHYLLLWLDDPAQGVREMARVVRRGGAVLACAEPDYGGRIDHPPEMSELGRLQTEALRRQGANPEIGRRLGELFTAAGLRVTVGVMGGQWKSEQRSDAAFEAEWAVRRHDLETLPEEQLQRLYETDRRALQAGRRTLFVPTFYAWGVQDARGGSE